MIMPRNITILYGLPGSGKTFYTKRLENDWTSIVHMDDYIVDGKYKPISEVLSSLKGILKRNLVIDSLITTQKKLEDIIKETYDFFERCGGARHDLTVVYWNEDRDACRENINRRADGRNVSVTINNIQFEEVDEDRIRGFVYNMDKNVHLSFKHRYVFKDNNWNNNFLPLIDNDNGKYIYSKEWSRGGTLCSWGGYEETIEPDEQPESFEEFDELLEKICPTITFLQYKKIFSECVDIDEFWLSDYYGGTEYKSRYRLDVKKLYDILREKDLIDE